MVNYIVSGMERSGTSMMMQILQAGGVAIAYDSVRQPDINNPKGYYELEGGKIINSLMQGMFPLQKYEDIFIKITAYGLKFLPVGDYKIIYMVRDIDEVLESMQKMSGKIDKNREKILFEKLNKLCISLMEEREDIDYLIISYNDTIKNRRETIVKINEFLGGILDVKDALEAIDVNLYRSVKI